MIQQSDAISALVEYAVACGLLAENDRIWARNAVLDALGASGQAPIPLLLHAGAQESDDGHDERVDCDDHGAAGDKCACASNAASKGQVCSDSSYGPCGSSFVYPDKSPALLERILSSLRQAAVHAGAIETPGQADLLLTRVMGALTPRPSQVIARFSELYRISPQSGTDYLYRLSCNVYYIRRTANASDLRWVAETPWGELEVSINCSKPEKDPRDIARAGETASAARGMASAPGAKTGGNVVPARYVEQGCTRVPAHDIGQDAGFLPQVPAISYPPGAGLAQPNSAHYLRGENDQAHTSSQTPVFYPACQLCWENEGYAGRDVGFPAGASPARQNLRIVPIELAGSRWGLQFSPYAYYPEHCIAINHEHVPMHIDRETFARLLAFVDLFPHYFVGSNADLPIVGGSILSHDHFQGGRHVFPMQKAPVVSTFTVQGFPQVKAGIVRWPLSVIRLFGGEARALVECAGAILDVWQAWSDPTVGVVCKSDGRRHNTITPIVRKVDRSYVLDLALRCNVTSPVRPLGVFHPRPSLHHIKRENIGLIEVMGLAILPSRLKPELHAVAEALVDERMGQTMDADPLTAKHAVWAREIAVRHPGINAANVRDILRDEVGLVFSRVLEDAGVFSWTDVGRNAFDHFVQALL